MYSLYIVSIKLDSMYGSITPHILLHIHPHRLHTPWLWYQDTPPHMTPDYLQDMYQLHQLLPSLQLPHWRRGTHLLSSQFQELHKSPQPFLPADPLHTDFVDLVLSIPPPQLWILAPPQGLSSPPPPL